MNRDDIRKLVGGYATGTLTDAERSFLFEAALDDQELFDELAGEHALKELLEEPGVRQRLADSLRPQDAPAPARLKWWMRPWPVSALGAVVLGLLLTVAVFRTPETQEIAAVTSAPRSNTPGSNTEVPKARLEPPESVPPQNAPAPAPPVAAPPAAPVPASAKTAPQSVGALAPAEEALRKDAGTAAPQIEARKAEAPAPTVQSEQALQPVQANESDRKEQTLTDAVQQKAQQQAQQQQQGNLQTQAAPQPQQSQGGPQLQQPATFLPPATQSVAVSEQERVQTGRGAAQNRLNPPAAGQRAPAAAKPKVALARQDAAKVASETANALPAFTWAIQNGVLRVTPARDGALRMEAPPREPMVVANARRGVVAEFAIPTEATSVRVVFSASNISADALSRAVNRRAVSRLGGSVPMSADAPNGPVSIEIPLK